MTEARSAIVIGAGFGGLALAIRLQSAGIAKVGGEPASQLVFIRDGSNEQVSLFSIKGDKFYTPRDGTQYDQMVNGHPIAGFVHNGTTHCVVGGKEAEAGAVAVRSRDQGELGPMPVEDFAARLATESVAP